MQVGSDYMVKVKGSKGSLTGGTFPPYPEWDIPKRVRVTAEYPTFYVVTCLPHISPHGMTSGPTDPYTVTLDKFEIGKSLEVKPCG